MSFEDKVIIEGKVAQSRRPRDERAAAYMVYCDDKKELKAKQKNLFNRIFRRSVFKRKLEELEQDYAEHDAWIKAKENKTAKLDTITVKSPSYMSAEETRQVAELQRLVLPDREK